MSKKLCIPNLGTILILDEDWTFKLYFEYRNLSMLKAVCDIDANIWSYWRKLEGKNFKSGEIPPEVEYEEPMTEEELEDSYKSYRATNSEENPFIRVTLKKGTQIKIDRIYVKRGAESFSSITFRTTKTGPEKKFASKRFWVKLKDANEIVADMI